MESVVIVGAGQAGVQAAHSLRETGYAGRIVLAGAEASLPYHRPPLSKAYLAGTVDEKALALRAVDFFRDQAIELRMGAPVAAVDRTAARTELEDGERIPYDHLVLATGSRNRALRVPGAELVGVHQLRSRTEADALRCALAASPQLTIVGAGFIGLEIAALAAQLGLRVTVVEAADRVMARAVSPMMSRLVGDLHERAGVEFVFNAAVVAIVERNGRAAELVLADGRHLETGLVLIGIGVVPNTELAAAAGLTVADGIVVDAMLTTSDCAISAIGDCSCFPTRFAADRHVRIESVQNATEQARALAANLLGNRRPYDAVPWFWSDQGSNKVQIAGLAVPHDTTILRGDRDSASVLCFRDGKLVGVESLNRTAEHMAARRLLSHGVALDPHLAQHPDFDLRIHTRQLLAARSRA